MADRRSSRGSTRAKRKKDLEEQHWYHGMLAREDIEKLLVKRGDFIVRVTDLQRSNQLVLSVHTGDRLIHLTIAVTDGRFHLGAMRKGRRFYTIFDLVQYYKHHKIKVKEETAKDLFLLDGIPRPKWLVRHDAIEYDKSKPPAGTGNFADVYKGTFAYEKGGKKQSVNVAIKILKAGSHPTREAKQSMISEGKIMSFYNHEHIVQFYGVAADRPPIAIVMEFCPGGSLEVHLKKQKADIVIGERIQYCLEAALGMRYLHTQGCIHRDLAARNCLISEKGQIKISDFGLSKVEGISEKEEHLTNIPLRWMAPETLVKTPVYSKKTDVWAYGVLLYEIFNRGEKPWPTEPNKKVATMIRHLQMPEMPSLTPKAMTALTAAIWIKNAEERPTFTLIVRKIREMQKSSDLKPPPIDKCAVNRIPNVKRCEYPKVEHPTEETVEEGTSTGSMEVAEENTPTNEEERAKNRKK